MPSAGRNKWTVDSTFLAPERSFCEEYTLYTIPYSELRSGAAEAALRSVASRSHSLNPVKYVVYIASVRTGVPAGAWHQFCRLHREE